MTRRLGALPHASPHAGQAMVELAVFGAVALAALGFLIEVGMKMNYDQEIRMAAFRKALAAAYADNAQASPTGESSQDALGTLYHYIDDRQMPNPTDGAMTLPRVRTEASGFVEWGDRFTFAYDKGNNDAGRKTHTRYVVRSNGTEQLYRGDDFPRDTRFILNWPIRITFWKEAFQPITSESVTTNTSNGTVTQSGGGSTLGSGTTTCSTTKINTLNGDTIGSCINSGTGVGW